MDDLVVIILTLIIVILGAVGQIKKKKPLQPNESQNKRSGDFWDFLEGEPEFVPQQTQFTPPSEPEPVEVMPEEKPEYKFTPKNEGKTSIKKELVENLKEEKKIKL